jgi:predicted nucleic acid-binding protein
MVADAILDTNVLVAATAPDRPGHEAAWDLLDGAERLATTPQIVREFLVVATRPPRANGLGLSVEVAVANVEIYLERLALLAEDARVVSRLRTLVAAGRAQGVPIHDANIVASALVHGARRIVTGNIRHFERFADLIPVEALN